MLFAKRKPALE